MFSQILVTDRNPDDRPDGISPAGIESAMAFADSPDTTVHLLHCGTVLSADSSRRANDRLCRPFGSDRRAEGRTQPYRRHDHDVFLWFGYDWQAIATATDSLADDAGYPIVRSYYPLVDWSRTETVRAYVARESIDLICVMAVAAAPGRSRGPTLADRLCAALGVPVLTLPTAPVEAVDADGSHADSDPNIDRILITNNGLQFDPRTARQAIDIARATDATIHALYIGLTGGYGPDSMGLIDRQQTDTHQPGVAYDEFLRSTYQARGRRATQRVSDLADGSGVDVEAAFRLGEHSLTDSLVAYVDAAAVDLVVLGTYHTHGVREYLGRSLSDRLVSRFGIPVLTTHLGTATPPRPD